MKVSIVIPARNEENFIGKCLRSIAEQTYPHSKIEVLVVDGVSEDNTADIVRQIASSVDIPIKLIENPQRRTPVGMNLGFKAAAGDVLIPFSAHAYMTPDFVEKNVEILNRTGADAAGGVVISAPDHRTYQARGIGVALNSPFALGGIAARVGKAARPITNPSFGAYRRYLFDRFGYIDDSLTRNQDYEFNMRIARGGAKIFFSREIRSYYYNRPTLVQLFRQYYLTSFWRVYMLGRFARAIRLRHTIPPLLLFFIVAMGLASIFSPTALKWLEIIGGGYIALSILASLIASIKGGIQYFPILPLSFWVVHTAYGLGFTAGLIWFRLLRKEPV